MSVVAYLYGNLVPSRHFQTLLDGDTQNVSLTGDMNDEIFIDRGGNVFEHVLHYLRTSQICITEEKKLQKLKSEASYYQLDKLEDVEDKLVQLKLTIKQEYMFLNNNDLLNHFQNSPEVIANDTNSAPEPNSKKFCRLIGTFDSLELTDRLSRYLRNYGGKGQKLQSF